MTKIFLIRHGETEWNTTGRLQGTSDVRLTANGIRQAKLLAARAPFQAADAIYCGDLVRAVATAEILAERFGLSVNVVPELREICFGDWEGQSIRALSESSAVGFENFFTAPDLCRPPHGETFIDCQARVTTALGKIIAANENRRVIVVSHGAVIRLMLCKILDMPVRKMWALAQHNTALNILRVDDGNFTVELLNGTAHLQTV